MAAKVKPFDPLEAIEELVEGVQKLADETRERLGENPMPCGSRALAFAVEAGFPPQMGYSFAQTARYTGVSEDTLRREQAAGRLRVFIPKGKERGAVVPVDAVDEWMEGGSR